MSEERRKDDGDMRQAIALLQQDMTYIKKALDINLEDFKEHIRTSTPFREKVSSVDQFKKSLDDHTSVDRWMFGLLISIQLAMFAKIAGAW